jgi:hypothetical protein
MFLSEGNELLDVAILPFVRPHEPDCSEEAKVLYRHLFYTWDYKPVRHKRQAQTGGDESKGPVIMVGTINNARHSADASERIHDILQESAPLWQNQTFAGKIGDRHGLPLREVMVCSNRKHIWQVEENPAGKLRRNPIIHDRKDGVTFAFCKGSEQVLAIAPSIAMAVCNLDRNVGMGVFKRDQQIGHPSNRQWRNNPNSQQPPISDRFDPAFTALHACRIILPASSRRAPAAVGTTCACRRSSSLTFSSVSSFAMLADIAG